MTCSYPEVVIPANAGIHFDLFADIPRKVVSRLRGNDGLESLRLAFGAHQ